MTLDVKSDKLNELISPDAQLEPLADGYGFLEGLVWDKAAAALNFSDITKNRRGRWVAATQTAEITMEPSNISNGLAYDEAGNLLVCEHATSSVVRESTDGQRTTIASHYEGNELNSPNDIVVAPGGAIYFTDPPYGRFPGWGVERDQDMDYQGVFMITTDGELKLVVKDFEGPNGLCFSPDNKTLYINDSARAHIRAFDLAADGTLTNERMHAENIGKGDPAEGIPDGMKCDERGNIWVTGPGGIWVLGPDGEHLGTILTPEGVGNLAWGGSDYRTLFIGSSSTLFRVETKVATHREPHM
jgi:gluconolactonase